jgi:hypothetical protein
MARIPAILTALAVLAGPALAAAQDTASAASDRPRLEFGAGGSVFFGGGTNPYTTGMVDTRVGVKLSRNWSVEGLVHFMPSGGADINGYYRAQALWRVGGGSVQPFLAFGGAGEFSRYSWPEYQWTRYDTGELIVTPAGSSVHIDPPWYPTASVGFEKTLASHIALRLELTTAFGINDYGIAVAFLPAASVSIPIGRYAKAAR